MNLNPWNIMLLSVAGWLNREQGTVIEYLKEENCVLRELLGDKRLRFNDGQRRRLAIKGKVLGRKLLSTVCSIVTPDKILRWHRKLIAQKYDGSAHRGLGRPRVLGIIQRLVIRMARENRTWGYERIQGALSNLSFNICETTIKRILKDHGIEPAPERSKKTTWKEFLSTHWESLTASDFFTVEVWTPFGLVRYMVFFVIDLSSRQVEIAGIAPDPNGAWMKQMARNLTDCFDGFLVGKRYLIHDRDPLYTTTFTSILKCTGIRCIKLPPKSPNLNAYAERFVRSIKYECLNRMIFFGEKHLRFTIKEYVEHYHTERNRQGIENKLIERNDAGEQCVGSVASHVRLGGKLKFYHRLAA